MAIKERERYKESTQLMSDGISAIPMLAVNDSVREFFCFVFIKVEASFTHYKSAKHIMSSVILCQNTESHL